MATAITKRSKSSSIQPSSAARSQPSRSGKLSRWGNSLGVRIPQEAVERLHLKEGESVNIECGADAITIRRSKPRRKYKESELLKGITPELCGPDLIPRPAGREII